MGAGGGEQADDNLAKVDHVVVMMLENRSFDHMLGYLSLTGGRPDIDGLRPGFANSCQGRSYPVHHLKTTAVELDPDHSSAAIDRQIAGGSMGGFVASAAATLAGRGDDDGDPGCVMGYYDGADVPVYDHLAGEFGVCDRWFSSVAGATLPNRLYALCGVAAGSRDDRPAHVPPLYHQPSFVRHLDTAGVPWRWYSFDPGTLRLADARYRLGHHDRFGYFSKTGLPWRAVLDLTCNQKLPSFLDDAAAGTLPAVSWIDPAFTNFNPLGFPVNDDHPPADIADGQDLVLAVYDALSVRDGFTLPEDDTGTQATTAQTPSPDSAGQPRSVTPGKDKVNEPIDANHPGRAASGSRRNLGRRGCSTARQGPDGEADRGEHP